MQVVSTSSPGRIMVTVYRLCLELIAPIHY